MTDKEREERRRQECEKEEGRQERREERAYERRQQQEYEQQQMEHNHEVGDRPFYSDCPACRIEQAAPALLADCKAVRQCLELIDNGEGRITSGCVYQQLVADIALAEKGTL